MTISATRKQMTHTPTEELMLPHASDGKSSKRTSRWARLAVICLVLASIYSGATLGQQQTSSDDSNAPVLTLEEAVNVALQQNRLVKNSALEAQKYDFQVNTARSRRKPQFQFTMLGGELLHSFDFTFPAGSFGTYPGTGPIPSTNAKIHTPAVFTTYLTGNIDQPITQQYKIGFGNSCDGTRARYCP